MSLKKPFLLQAGGLWACAHRTSISPRHMSLITIARTAKGAYLKYAEHVRYHNPDLRKIRNLSV